ncbi:MAG: hypothetical protein FWF94_04850 [Oscillospiraceae bacterium]|nr:hypothetical protein [Oscillospiraceae bacterium]
MNAYFKDLFREIKNTMGRFLSLLILASLGTSSVVGIQAAAIDMRNIADKTYKEHRLYDLQIKSTMGFDDDDIAALKNNAETYLVMPTTIIDVYANVADINSAVRTYALPDGVNTIDIIAGRFPEKADECVIEERHLLNDGNIQIGDSIQLSLENMDDYHELIDNETFTIVGVATSPLYITFQRGNTALGDGSLQYYMYLHPSAYSLDVYTDVFVVMDGSKTLNNLTDEYYEFAEEWKGTIDTIGDLRVGDMVRELKDAQEEIDDGWVEYYDGEAELEAELEKVRGELADAEIELADAYTELTDGQLTLNREISDGWDEIYENEQKIKDGQAELDEKRKELEEGQRTLDIALALLESSKAELTMMGPYGVSPELDAIYDELNASFREVERGLEKLDDGRTLIIEAQAEIDDGIRELNDARITIEEERVKAQKEIDDGWIEYYDGLAEYNDGLKTLRDEERDARIELADAKLELEDAQDKLDDAPDPEWFIFTRKDGLDFDSYYQDTMRLQRIGYVFPLVFFLVAIMVTLTTMSRMVEESRTQIGIYKALGYRPFSILFKYLLYAISSALIGGVAGVIWGSKLFPFIISDAYGHMYTLPPIYMPVPFLLSVVAVAISVLSVIIVTLWTYLSAMGGTPALLMRPKSPLDGKRVLLERITPVWKRLGFFSKVTVRNILRYKKRFIMSLAGVAGCTALLVTAFGLSDSIAGVVELQYGTIIKYNTRAYLKEIERNKQIEELNAILPAAHLFIREAAVTANGKNGGMSAAVIVPQSLEDMSDYISLYSPDNNKPVAIDNNSVLLTEKLARVMGVKAGDAFEMVYDDGRSFTAEATDIVDNYIQHYIYMSPEMYKNTFDEAPNPNSVFVFNENDNKDYVTDLLDNKSVRAVVHNDELMTYIGDSTDAMKIVTVVLIFIACILAVVVLFNLTNINITERIRELATIKVLGFYNSELAMYIYRENGIVTAVGILTGIIGGILLHGFVITTVEIDVLKFPVLINLSSYIKASLLTLLFAVSVNLVMNTRLSKIDMVESLKNVE